MHSSSEMKPVVAMKHHLKYPPILILRGWGGSAGGFGSRHVTESFFFFFGDIPPPAVDVQAGNAHLSISTLSNISHSCD